MRRDALARREALIAAARICFARSGYFVPLEEIADAAGVGRGTFYRNFKDRMALALAVFEHEVDRLRPLVDPDLPLDRALARIVIEGAGATNLFTRLAIDMPLDGENRAAFEGLRERLEMLLRPLVERCHRDGTLAPALHARELVLAMRMLGGVMLPRHSEAERCAHLDAALALVMVGLRPR
ncbi:MAG: hypothetical protein DI544_10260 [Sphingomonas taxi]|uniref:HTH tetR-type domain-containing protein n=1 Tax=Sphingomonas taxi TaxID=1549858 RepID=A0A2W5P791_9SPHN|nr:MAG: hypothetical protein DI544_10260 [Sphingomonas taxi]